MENNLKQLQSELYDAKREYDTLDSQHRDRRDALVREAQAKAYDEFRERLNAAYKKRSDAIAAELAERDRVAREAHTSPFKVGTRLIAWEWRNVSGRWNENAKFEWSKTENYGVMEVITNDSEHPANTRSHAKVGDVVIRGLTKGGTAKGRSYVRVTRPLDNGVLPTYDSRGNLYWAEFGFTPTIKPEHR